MFVTAIIDIGARGARWRALLDADRAAAVQPGPRLHLHRVPRQQRPAGTAGRAVPEPRAGRRRGHQPADGARHGRRGTGRGHGHGGRDRRDRGPGAERPRRDDERRAARAGLRRACWSSRSGWASSPTGCPVPIASRDHRPTAATARAGPPAARRPGGGPAAPRDRRRARLQRGGLDRVDRHVPGGRPGRRGRAVGRPGRPDHQRRGARLDRPVRSRLRRHVRADRRGHRRRARHPARSGVRARPAGPRRGPAGHVGRWRDRDARPAPPARGRGRIGRPRSRGAGPRRDRGQELPERPRAPHTCGTGRCAAGSTSGRTPPTCPRRACPGSATSATTASGRWAASG